VERAEVAHDGVDGGVHGGAVGDVEDDAAAAGERRERLGDRFGADRRRRRADDAKALRAKREVRP